MECKFCGGQTYIGHQVCHMDVLVDASGAFLDNMPGGAVASIYESNPPFGPFQCCGCGAVYGELKDGEEAESGPIEGWAFEDKVDDADTNGVVALTLIRQRACEHESWANELFVCVEKEAFQKSSSCAEATEKFVMRVLRNRIQSWLSTPDGWQSNCDTSRDYNWGDLINDSPAEQIKVFFSREESKGYEILDCACVCVNQDERLAPDHVPADLVLVFHDGHRELLEASVDFQNGDIFCDTAFEEEKVARAYIQTADNAELACSPENGFLSLAEI